MRLRFAAFGWIKFAQGHCMMRLPDAIGSGSGCGECAPRLRYALPRTAAAREII